jgi:hypothetical protein
MHKPHPPATHDAHTAAAAADQPTHFLAIFFNRSAALLPRSPLALLILLLKTGLNCRAGVLSIARGSEEGRLSIVSDQALVRKDGLIGQPRKCD